MKSSVFGSFVTRRSSDISTAQCSPDNALDSLLFDNCFEQEIAPDFKIDSRSKEIFKS